MTKMHDNSSKANALAVSSRLAFLLVVKGSSASGSLCTEHVGFSLAGRKRRDVGRLYSRARECSRSERDVRSAATRNENTKLYRDGKSTSGGPAVVCVD